MTGVADNNYDLISNRTNLINNHNYAFKTMGSTKHHVSKLHVTENPLHCTNLNEYTLWLNYCPH